jgi:ATP-dependent DNA helicase RecG
VHNDYTNEIPPKFELFADRIEITSAGGLPEGLSQQEFFEGYSVPRNQEIMRIFKDLGLVEHLGSGVPRILESYDKDCFKFSDNFLRMSFPATEQVIPQVTPQVTPQLGQLISVIEGELNRQDIQEELNLNDRMNFMNNYLKPAIEQGLIEMTIPNKPNSRLQKYRLTQKGMSLKQSP